MLRHACGFKLANDGQDTRAIQHYLGHRNIQHTVRYTELSPDRFKGFWNDQGVKEPWIITGRITFSHHDPQQGGQVRRLSD
jgi:hypothetical protein